MGYIAQFLGQILYYIYKIAFHNYGLAIIIFTLFIKVLLLPLAVKQYRSTVKLQELQPQIEDIKKRYKTDKDKQNQEMLKLYQENKANPTGGCLPTLVQMPILLSLYWVIQSPLKYMLNKSSHVINWAYEFVLQNGGEKISHMKDITVINFFNNHPDKFNALLATHKDFLDKNKLADVLSNQLGNNDLINMNFLGIFNLGLKPEFDFGKLFGSMSAQYLPLILIPILCWITTFLSIRMSMPKTAAQNNAANNAAQMQKSMSFIMPFVTMFFAFSVPAGLGLYWIVSNLFQILQQWYMNKYIIKKREVAEK